MDQKFQDFEKTIKRKHSVAFTPKYHEGFTAKIKPRIFVEIAVKTFEALDWEVVYQDKNQVEAKRENDFGKWTHKITAKMNYTGKAEVESKSLEGIWDQGKNSKWVKLFIYAFNETLKSFDTEKLAALETEVERKDNLDDYVIPESLPAPKNFSRPQLLIPILGTGLVATAIAYLVALLSLEGLYVIGLYEVGIGVILGFVLKIFMKLGNYTNWKTIKLVLLGAVILIFVLNQYFQYQLIMTRNHYEPIGFIAFLRIRLEHGLTIKDLNVGTIGLLISWIFQIGVTCLVGYLRTLIAIMKISVNRVPTEVIDFAIYHFIKSKSELKVKSELSKMGWKSELEHQMVFDALAGLQGGQQMRREG